MLKITDHIHFVGIGGIGMSGLAKILRLQGYSVSGSDLSAKNKILDSLEKIGCIIYFNHDSSNVKDASVLVRSSAINYSNPEISAALKKEIPIFHRSEILGFLMKNKQSIAVTGMHGKTTTTSLLAHIFLESKKDPTIISGGIMKNLDSNAVFGSSNFLIAEADESDKSFLNLFPSSAIITNIDLEHLDNYRDLEDIVDNFKKFIDRLPASGKAFICSDDKNIQSLIEYAKDRSITYGLNQSATYSAAIFEQSESYSVFEVFFNNGLSKKSLGIINLPLAGTHNIQNALGAIAVATYYGLSFDSIKAALTKFLGVERRFDFRGVFRGAQVFDDYGHHPVEIEKVFEVARKRAKKKLIIAFQPHRYSRTQKLWDDFVNILSSCPADFLLITDIFPASELPIEGITSEKLNPTKRIFYTTSFEDIKNFLNKTLDKDDLFLTLGAGKLDFLANELCKKF
jgi:UDP-N-acetylmuramate--alanine ligase